MGHNYLNYHHRIVGNFSEQICRFCGEEREEFIHLACECPALARERLSSVSSLADNLQTCGALSDSHKWIVLVGPWKGG